MLIVKQTATFQRQAAAIWSAAELAELIDYVSNNPTAGDVIPGTGGMRKVRWSRAGMGKRGGARVIYVNVQNATIWLVLAYTKAKLDNVAAKVLVALKKEIE